MAGRFTVYVVDSSFHDCLILAQKEEIFPSLGMALLGVPLEYTLFHWAFCMSKTIDCILLAFGSFKRVSFLTLDEYVMFLSIPRGFLSVCGCVGLGLSP